MRFTLSTTMVIAHLLGLILSCAALFVSVRICLGDALPGPDLAAALFPGLVAVALLAGIGSLFIVNRLHPLKKMLQYARTVGAGDSTASLDVESSGSLKPLAEAIRTMAETCDGRSHWYASILNTLPWAISVTDMDMNWTFCNTASLKSMNKTHMDEVRGLHCSEKKGNICNTPQCGIEQLRLGNKRVINNMPNGKTMQIMLDYLYDASGTWKPARTSPKKSAWNRKAKQPPPRPAPPWWHNWKVWSARSTKPPRRCITPFPASRTRPGWPPPDWPKRPRP